MRRANGRVIAAMGLAAIAGSIGWSASAGAEINFSVDLTWGETTPECVGEVVCSGVGTKELTSGVPFAEGATPTRLTVTELPSALQPGEAPVPIGTLRYCNGETVGDTDITSVALLADFQVVGGGSGSTSDVTTLLVTENSEDPEASADTLYLASDPSTAYVVRENECADIPLLGRVTLQPTLTVSLGPTGTTTSTTTTTTTTTSTTSTTTSTTTTTVAGATSTTTTTTTVASDPRCPAAYAPKCAPDVRADWNCPTAATNALPAEWVNVKVDGSLPAAQQDPWGLDGPPGAATDGTPNVGCESSTATSTGNGDVSVAGSTTTRQSGTGATGLAATGASQTGPLALFSIGLVMIGVATAKTALDRRWIPTSHPGVRYTIDSRRRVR